MLCLALYQGTHTSSNAPATAHPTRNARPQAMLSGSRVRLEAICLNWASLSLDRGGPMLPLAASPSTC